MLLEDRSGWSNFMLMFTFMFNVYVYDAHLDFSLRLLFTFTYTDNPRTIQTSRSCRKLFWHSLVIFGLIIGFTWLINVKKWFPISFSLINDNFIFSDFSQIWNFGFALFGEADVFPLLGDGFLIQEQHGNDAFMGGGVHHPPRFFVFHDARFRFVCLLQQFHGKWVPHSPSLPWTPSFTGRPRPFCPPC